MNKKKQLLERKTQNDISSDNQDTAQFSKPQQKVLVLYPINH